MKVAVVGAGPAGLATAIELQREGLEPCILEQGEGVGGTWRYSTAVEDDPLGQTSHGRLHGSMYASLRTNLPRQVMAHPDYAFEAEALYPGHEAVLSYLEALCAHFDLERHIRFGARVTRIRREAGAWSVTADGAEAQRFDAVAVCNGHYAEPRLIPIDGLEHFSGSQLHAHNYRVPSDVQGRRVLVIGSSASGEDLALELWRDGRDVAWSGGSHGAIDERPGLTKVGLPVRCLDGSRIELEHHVVREFDAVVFCTGYHYHFPFLGDLVTVDDNWVRPLYQHVVHVDDPTLALIGLPFLVIPLPLFQCQARWWSRWLAGKFELPSAAERAHHEAQLAAEIDAKGVLPRHVHRLGLHQVGYMNELNAQCGLPPVSADFIQAMKDARDHKARDPEGYRGELPSTRPR